MRGVYDLDQQQFYPEDDDGLDETRTVRVWVEGYADVELPLYADKDEAEKEVHIGDYHFITFGLMTNKKSTYWNRR